MTGDKSSRHHWTKIEIVGALAVLGVLGMALRTDPSDSLPSMTMTSAKPGWIGKPEKLAGMGNYVVLMPNNADPDTVQAQAKAVCASEKSCQVMGWTDSANMAHVLPMLDREVEAQAFSYVVNRITGAEIVLWDCRKFKVSPDNCLPK